jgi:enterochelin esterase family protein
MRWSTRGEGDVTLERMLARREIGEFIVVMPLSSSNGFYTNARDGSGSWEDALVAEFIPMIESSYRVNASRPARGISGISMGGYGALKIAMKHPDLFGSVSAHSSALVPDLLNTTPIVRLYLSLAEVIYGIGLGGTNADFSYWNANNPLELAKDPAKFEGMKIYFDCGTEDMYGFYDGHKVLDELLTKAKYPHTAGLYSGPHGWDFAKDHMHDSMLFHWNVFATAR